MGATEQQIVKQRSDHYGQWYVCPNQVRYQETDQMGVVFHSNYLSWFEMGRTAYIRAVGMPYTQIEHEGDILLPLTDATMKFVRPARYDDNVLIYATSNRRHLIRETWSDRSDMSADELHRSDTVQEKLSLVSRFGLAVNFSSPSHKEYMAIVLELARRTPSLDISEQDLLAQANIWELSGGGPSGRSAAQFIISLLAKAGRHE
jgi:YbgC/YbaW family acyl-CoA thioester hydrolase